MNDTGYNNIFSVSFAKMEKDADQRLQDAVSALNQEREAIAPLAEGKTSFSVLADLLGFLFVALLFAAAIFSVWKFGGAPHIVNLVGTIYFGVFFLIMFLKRAVTGSHSSRAIQKMDQIDVLEKHVTGIRNDMSNLSKEFIAGLRENKEEKIEPGVCIDGKLKEMKSMSHKVARVGALSWLEKVLYFGAGVVMTVMGSLALWKLIDLIFSNFDLPILVVHIVCIVSMVIVSVAMIIASKYVWGLTDCKVKNLTLLLILLGPVAFLILFAAIAIVLLLVAVALYIIFGLIGVAIVIFCISASGGG